MQLNEYHGKLKIMETGGLLAVVLYKAQNILDALREVVKYYFADFVRKGGTPAPPKSAK